MEKRSYALSRDALVKLRVVDCVVRIEERSYALSRVALVKL